jgi:hypothetical protein
MIGSNGLAAIADAIIPTGATAIATKLAAQKNKAQKLKLHRISENPLLGKDRPRSADAEKFTLPMTGCVNHSTNFLPEFSAILVWVVDAWPLWGRFFNRDDLKSFTLLIGLGTQPFQRVVSQT